VDLKRGELFVVKKGVEHKPMAEKECAVLLIEPRGVVNTGEAESELRAENDVWV
jgi:mannose-6-phosphate isomerase-like protein (cupin superfamily)